MRLVLVLLMPKHWYRNHIIPVRDIIEAATAALVIRMVLYVKVVRGTCQLAVMQNPTSLIDSSPRSIGRKSAFQGHGLHCT